MLRKRQEEQSKDRQILSEIRGLRNDIKSQSKREQLRNAAGKVIGNTFKSVGNIGRSFGTANSNDRPRIANLPNSKPPISSIF